MGSQEKKQKMNTLENKIKTFKENLTKNESNQQYLKYKSDLNYIYDQKIEGIKINKCSCVKILKNLQFFF